MASINLIAVILLTDYLLYLCLCSRGQASGKILVFCQKC